MNDSKYGRLYPERAVKPLRELAFSLINDGRLSSTTHDALRAAVIDLDGLGFPPDEPLFLLRGQDRLAAKTVEFYFHCQKEAGLPVNWAHVSEHIKTMVQWEPQKLPD